MMKKLNAIDMTKNDVEEAVDKNVEIEEVVEAVEMDAVSVEAVDEEESRFKKILKIADKVHDAFINVALVVIFSVLGFLLFFGSNHLIDGKSMDSTLADGDHVISVKSLNSMDRGDIVIASPEQMNDRMIIKRVIAFEGDTISINAGEVSVNGEVIEEDYVDNPAIEDFQEEIEIPEGHVWIMGDNRNNSLDSRRIGFVSIDDLDGLAVARILPLKKIEMLK